MLYVRPLFIREVRLIEYCTLYVLTIMRGSLGAYILIRIGGQTKRLNFLVR